MYIRNRTLIIALLLLAITIAKAQTFEIRAVNKGDGIVGVEMRATSGTPPDTTNNVTDIVFGLKWLSIYNVNLVSSINTSYYIIKSDTQKLKNGFYFQAFSATNTPYLFPPNWSLNNWVEIMNIANDRKSITDTGTFEICETGFDITTDPNFGIDLTDYTPVTTESATGVLLPLSFLKFDVRAQQKAINLSWTTSSENNNKGFIIQRSAKDAARFDSISWVEGRNNSLGNSYSFIDRNVQAGIVYYYRLKQVDLNGRTTFSETKSAKIEDIENSSFKILPNPAVSSLQVTYLGNSENIKTRLRVIDSKGSTIYEQLKTFATGVNAFINVTTFSQGQYYLIIEQNGEIIYRKPFQKG